MRATTSPAWPTASIRRPRFARAASNRSRCRPEFLQPSLHQHSPRRSRRYPSPSLMVANAIKTGMNILVDKIGNFFPGNFSGAYVFIASRDSLQFEWSGAACFTGPDASDSFAQPSPAPAPPTRHQSQSSGIFSLCPGRMACTE